MFKKVLEYAGEYRRTTYASIAVMLLGVLMSVLPYFSIYRLIAPPLTGELANPGQSLLWAAAIALCGVLYALLYVKGLSLSHRAAYSTLRNLRVSLQGRLEKQPLGVIKEKGTGTLKKMFTDDIDSIELLLAHALPEGLANVAVPFFVFIAMFFVDWKLALLSLCSLPLGLAAMGAMYQAGTSKVGDYYASARKMNNTIVEYINGMEVVKVFNRDGDSYRRFEQDVRGYRDFTLAWYKVCWPWMALYNSILPCVALFTLPVGAFLVLKDYSTLPDLALVLCMSFGTAAPLLRALSFLAAMPQVSYKIHALEQLMSALPLAQTEAPFSGRDHTVTFDRVHFAYREEVLHGISLTVPEGSLTALVGESGSGKSTLAKLLVHYYDVTGGAIRLGGQDLRDMSLQALNDQISYVSQEQFLFNTSLLENIRAGRLTATDEEVMEAARKAQCMEFLDRLPEGIHTMAGDGGKQLSGGERQRICLARAILKDAPVIVLDEATASVDADNEQYIQEAISELCRGKTLLVIAHRLHTIRDADQILVIRDGRIAQRGTHDLLMEEGGPYRDLVSAREQSQGWNRRPA
ncbi:ABC transporter ATP-binding protein [Faecalicatena contorta]|uniref:ABC transporter ATP-binding protein n=1 Tax=Faecalicatena contorta TaxID=39482 RepID=UPI0019611339|nr:ABC transporter ATP-binding protein [Faecalicatena contorta]MBM6686251.1 ABC transporter ATP-binding protein [Faecalicatena contorta]MBM6711640.1 ABC transporter ATP-binding protein [Faecalicatena contorta]